MLIRDSSGKRDVWVIDLARGVKTRLTFDPADKTNPVWSPDGSEIAYSSDARGHRDLYARPSSGTGQERALLESPEDKSLLDWSADGKVLSYNVQSHKTDRDIWMLPMTGAARTPWLFLGTPFREDIAQFSPDSRWILYRSNESGRLELYVQPLPPIGQKWLISHTGVDDFQWRGDGREIFYIAGDTMHWWMCRCPDLRCSPAVRRRCFGCRGYERIAKPIHRDSGRAAIAGHQRGAGAG